MVQAADVRRGDDGAAFGQLDVAGNRRVVVERHVRASFVIVAKEFGQQPLQAVSYTHLTLPTNREV